MVLSFAEEKAIQPIVLPLAALVLLGAADAPAAPPPKPHVAVRDMTPVSPTDTQCRDRITRAREAAGKPPLLEREPASPDKPYHIYAVDRRQDGCAVMVMKGDTADIRPLPAKPEGPLVIIPLGAGR